LEKQETVSEEVTPLKDIFGSDTQSRLIFDLVRAIVADRIKINTLEKVLVEKGILSKEELQKYYNDELSNSSDDVINQVLQEYGSVDNGY